MSWGGGARRRMRAKGVRLRHNFDPDIGLERDDRRVRDIRNKQIIDNYRKVKNDFFYSWESAI